MEKPKRATSGENRGNLRTVFKDTVTATWETALQRGGFQLIAVQDEGLFTSFLYRRILAFASISIDWREGDIESRVGVADDDGVDRRATSIWDIPHHVLLEPYAQAIVPATWQELRGRMVANVQLPDEPLSSRHIIERVAFLVEVFEAVLPEILRAPDSIVKLSEH